MGYLDLYVMYAASIHLALPECKSDIKHKKSLVRSRYTPVPAGLSFLLQCSNLGQISFIEVLLF